MYSGQGMLSLSHSMRAGRLTELKTLTMNGGFEWTVAQDEGFRELYLQLFRYVRMCESRHVQLSLVHLCQRVTILSLPGFLLTSEIPYRR